jgi:hypothetical protein
MRVTLAGAILSLLILGCGGETGHNPSQPTPEERVAHIALTVPATLTVGDTVTATAVAEDSQFVALPTVPIAWQSLNTGVLTTTNSGFITAVSTGVTILRLTAGNVSFDQTMTVTP